MIVKSPLIILSVISSNAELLKYKHTINKMNTRKLIVEFIGTFFLMLFLTMLIKSGKVTGFEGLAIASTYIAMIYANKSISGAHFNPAVSLAFFIRGIMTINETVAYIGAQLVGAIFAVFSADAMLQGIATSNDNLPIRIDPIPSFLAEFFGTFAVVYVVLSVLASKRTENNGYSGLAVGLMFLASYYALGAVSGGAFNPAIAIGYCLGNIAEWSTSWTYFLGETIAAAIAAIIFKYLENEIN